MSSWFSRSRKPSGDGGNANERDDTTDRNGFENGRYTTVPDDDDGEARVDNNNINNKSNIRSANRHVLNDFTIPDEEYDPDFEADLARAISESLSCGGAVTPSRRLVSRNGGGGWSLFC